MITRRPQFAARLNAAFQRGGFGDEDPAHSLHAWQRCYDAFDESGASRDTLPLHLAAFLASFGMMRGSSPIFRTNYTVHARAVDILRSPDAIQLRGRRQLSDDTIDLIVEVARRLKNSYAPRDVTDILVTKVMMGALGCVPAYDRFVRAALGEAGVIQTFGRKSLLQVVEMTEAYSDDLRQLSVLPYPAPRALDMLLNRIGGEIEKEKADRRKAQKTLFSAQ